MALRLIDLEGNHYPAEASTGMDEELNSDSMLSISFQSTRINNHFISGLSELWRISGVKGPSDDTEYVINFLTRKGIGDKMIAHVRAIPKMFDDLAKEREYERFDQSFTAHNFFTLVFKDTPYTFVLLDSFGALRFEGLGEGDQKIEMFIHGINRYGIEFEIVGKEVRMRKRVERDMPYQLRWRLNASNIQEEIDATGFVTYAKGYGDYGDGEGGEDWQEAKLVREYTSPLAQIPGIGIRHAQPIKNGNITDVNTMDDNLKLLVDESLKVSVTADFHRLKNYPYAEPQKGDLIHLIDERINFKRKVRVIKVVTYRDSKGNIKKQDVTFGDVGITKRHQAKINNSINTVDRIMEGRQKIPFSVLDDAVLAATKALQNAQTELVFPESGGIHAIDKTNPNKMVVYNSAGIGISDDGGQTFKTAITGDGIVADVITAGTIRGIDIVGTNIMSYSTDNNDVITMADGEIETFVSGVKRFGIYGEGLKVFSWVTGEEVARFRSTNLSGAYGAGIMGSGSYFNIGEKDPITGSDISYLFFDFEEKSISARVDMFEVGGNLKVDGSLGDASFSTVAINNANDHNQPRYYWEYNSSNGALELLSMDSSNDWWYRMEFVGRGEGSRVQFYNNMYNEWVYASESTNAANMRVASSGRFYRSTSSQKYKKDIENLNYDFAEDIVKNLRPVWYRPKKIDTDDVKENWSHVGLISEEVATVEPRLVDFNLFDEEGDFLESPIPEGVQYPLLGVYLLPVVQKLMNKVEDLEIKLKGVI